MFTKLCKGRKRYYPKYYLNITITIFSNLRAEFATEDDISSLTTIDRAITSSLSLQSLEGVFDFQFCLSTADDFQVFIFIIKKIAQRK